MNTSFLTSHIPTIAAVPRTTLAGPIAQAEVSLSSIDYHEQALFSTPKALAPSTSPPRWRLAPREAVPFPERSAVEGFDPGTLTSTPFGQTARTSANGTLFMEEPKVEAWERDHSEDLFDVEEVRDFDSHGFRGMPGQRTFPKALRKDWEAKMGINPADYFETLFETPRVKLGGGEVAVTRVNGALEELEVSMDLRDPQSGQAIGQMNRQFSFPPDGAPEVYHSYFGLEPEAQGKGIAKDLLANSIEVYEQAGISKVGVFAALDVGGYAWAKYGFRPKAGAATEDLYDTVRDRLSDLELPARTKSMVRRLMANDNPRAIWALSDLNLPVAGEGGSQISLGKALLMGTSWPGTLDLDDPASRARFDQYIQRS